MKYKELADLFRAQILSGEVKAGEKLFESIAAVSAERGASNYSIRAALDVLAAEGLVEVRQGYGTVVVHRAGLNTPPQHIARILESSNPPSSGPGRSPGAGRWSQHRCPGFMPTQPPLCPRWPAPWTGCPAAGSRSTSPVRAPI